MWLIDTTTYELHEFVGDALPPYAILSHCWGSFSDEVSFKQFRKGLNANSAGHEKIRGFCREAARCDLRLGWVDTCCIDKRSSAELSEAINSMYDWYAKAAICFVYLSDLNREGDWRNSKWWLRGWTLQELIAPKKVNFYDSTWCNFGTRNGMSSEIAKLTEIPRSILERPSTLASWNLAQKMSWAARRQTTRIEDRAYSLLGIFQLNMPLLYGEGAAAFQRLQLRLLEKYPDESLFAWSPRHSNPGAHNTLAESPDDFRPCKFTRPLDEDKSIIPDAYIRRVNPPRVTSWGIEMRVTAQKLIPNRRLVVNGQMQRFLPAFSPAVGQDGCMQELPCTLVLVRSGPAPYTYQRYQCLYGEFEECRQKLARDFDVLDEEFDFLIYLKFDSHV